MQLVRRVFLASGPKSPTAEAAFATEYLTDHPSAFVADKPGDKTGWIVRFSESTTWAVRQNRLQDVG